MKFIAEGSELIKILSGYSSILDSGVEKITIQLEEELLTVNIYFDMMYTEKFKKVLIKLIDIIEYGFYHNNRHAFYCVETYKFFQTEDGRFYISLDPEDEQMVESENDQDFVISKKIIGYDIS